MWGKQPYNDNNSAKDNFVLALFTNGEGYHNFHHKFQFDYRNGVRWYQWDPTKWFILILSLFRQAHDLQRVTRSQIMIAKMTMKHERLTLVNPTISAKLDLFKQKVEAAHMKLKNLSREYQLLKNNIRQQSREKLIQLKADLKIAKIELDKTCQQWNLCLRAARAVV